MSNVIKQIVKEGQFGEQTIKMVVKDNERGPKGDTGAKGDAATITAGQAYTVPASYGPSVINTGTANDAVFDFYIPAGKDGEKGPQGPAGKDGAIHYTAGTGIEISDDNEISADIDWGEIGGDITDQTDLMQKISESGKTYTAGDGISISAQDAISLSTGPKNFFYQALGTTYENSFIHGKILHNDTIGGEYNYLYFIGNLLEPTTHATPSSPQSPLITTGTQKVVITTGSSYVDDPTENTEKQVYDIPLGSLELYGFSHPTSHTGYSSGFAAERSDVLKKREGETGWWIERKVVKATYNGSESWQQDGYAFYLEVYVDNPQLTRSPIMCDHFWNNFASNSQSPTDESYRGQCWASNGRIYFMPTDTTQTTVSAFTTWLSSNNITVYYLTTQSHYTYTQITDSSLSSALDALQNAYAYSSNNTAMYVLPPSSSYSFGGLAYSLPTANLANLTYQITDIEQSIPAPTTVVQTTGNSTTSVMSQDATTSMVFADPSTKSQVKIGSGSSVGTFRNVAIGQNATASNTNTLAVGSYAWTNAASSTAVGDGTIAGGVGGTAIGHLASAGTNQYSVALGAQSTTSRDGEVNVGVGSTGYGYNSTSYRVIGGVHDGQNAHDAATVGQLNGRILQNAGAPTTSTVGTVGQILEDTTNGKLYQCTAIDNTDPNAPVYTWSEVGGGGGTTYTYKVLTSNDYNWNSSTSTAEAPFDSVALWLLPSGIYYCNDTSVTVREIKTGSALDVTKYNTFIISIGTDSNSNQYASIIYFGTNHTDLNNGYLPLLNYRITTVSTGQSSDNIKTGAFVTTNQIINNWDTNKANAVLSAAQGKALRDLMRPDTGTSDPTVTAPMGVVGKIYIKTDTNDAYMLVSDAGGVYTWKKITS